jgi:hypothetical protein
MTVDEIKKMYSQPPQKRVYPKVKDRNITEETIPAEYCLTFGKFKGEKISSIPTYYLEWIVTNVTSRPDVVELVTRYLSQPQPQEKPAFVSKKMSMAKKMSMFNLQGLQPRRPLSPPAAIEEGDIRFEPYVFPDFSHPMMGTTVGGVSIMDISIQKLAAILECHPNPKLEDFVNRRSLHLYRWFVYDRYQKALRLDVSTFTPGEAFQYERCLNLCRKIQNVLDNVSDPAVAREILSGPALRGPAFDSVCDVKLPRTV